MAEATEKEPPPNVAEPEYKLESPFVWGFYDEYNKGTMSVDAIRDKYVEAYSKTIPPTFSKQTLRGVRICHLPHSTYDNTNANLRK